MSADSVIPATGEAGQGRSAAQSTERRANKRRKSGASQSSKRVSSFGSGGGGGGAKKRTTTARKKRASSDSRARKAGYYEGELGDLNDGLLRGGASGSASGSAAPASRAAPESAPAPAPAPPSQTAKYDDSAGSRQPAQQESVKEESTSKDRERVRVMHNRARAAAERGDCDAAAELARQIRGLDAVYYRDVLRTDKLLRKCLSGL